MTILKNLLRLLLKKEAASAASILISTDFFDYPAAMLSLAYDHCVKILILLLPDSLQTFYYAVDANIRVRVVKAEDCIRKVFIDMIFAGNVFVGFSLLDCLEGACYNLCEIVWEDILGIV